MTPENYPKSCNRDRQLMPLKVPAGWAVTYNKFLDWVPFSQDEIDRSTSFTEDVLQIVKLDLIDGNYIIPKKHILIDLGWYPDCDIKGEYTLECAIIDPDSQSLWNTLTKFSSRDAELIKSTIEDWLCRLVSVSFKHQSNPDEIIRLFDVKSE